jgi:hypothetical protein
MIEALTDEQNGRSEGLRWADEHAETWGLNWFDFNEAHSPWEVFKRCYALGGSAPDGEVYAVMFGDEPYNEEFIRAFVSASIERFAELKTGPLGRRQ